MCNRRCRRLFTTIVGRLTRKIFLHRQICLVSIVTATILGNLLYAFNSNKQPIPDLDSDALKRQTGNDGKHIYTDQQMRVTSMPYSCISDRKSKYEFCYQFNTGQNTEDHRLMILLVDENRTCTDLWKFPVGRRLLTAISSKGYSILAICARAKQFNTKLPLIINNDVKAIHRALVKWMNDVYYRHHRCYPRLFLYGFGYGSKFASILSRLLPIQSLILSLTPGDATLMPTPSNYSRAMQTRLQLDPTFANWFYFDFCYRTKKIKEYHQGLCPFQNVSLYLAPLPPTYFIALEKNILTPVKDFQQIASKLRNQSSHLRGIFLDVIETIQLDVLSPVSLTPDYMQKHFDPWQQKPMASILFAQIYNDANAPKTTNTKRGTCSCSTIDFEASSDFVQTWTRQKQEEYKNYVHDIRENREAFCEEICGEVKAQYGMSSRNIPTVLQWIKKIDQSRFSSQIQDYLNRPLRVWAYPKEEMTQGLGNYSSNDTNWNVLSPPFRMYVSEYLLRDYFQRLKTANVTPHPNLVWTEDPLLADYFVIFHDLMYFYFLSQPQYCTNAKFARVRQQLSDDYFEKILDRIRQRYPYWTLTFRESQQGANHVIPFVNGRNMGYLHEKLRKQLNNVIQIGFTGIRQDLAPVGSPIPYPYRNVTIDYRHRYDIIVPQFTPLKLNSSEIPDETVMFQAKKTLTFFAGALSHFTTMDAARVQLRHLWNAFRTNKSNGNTTKIEGKIYETLKLVNGHMAPNDYFNSLWSSVFLLCPEGFLPWSPRLYEAIQLRSIPIILSDNIVLPFERFVNWQSFTAKVHVKNIPVMINLVRNITKFELYVKQKLKNAIPYYDAFRWPYIVANRSGINRHVFLPDEGYNKTIKNVFYYLSLELRCRRLEQFYGLTSDSPSTESVAVQQTVCQQYPTICPCYDQRTPLAFHEYL